MSRSTTLGPTASPSALQRELAAIATRRPDLRPLLQPAADEPDAVDATVLWPGPAPLVVIAVPIPGRAGRIWASRLPGTYPPATERNLDALTGFGIVRIVCLVPAQAMSNLHGAPRYLSTARARFGPRFHLLQVADHGVPPDDEGFESTVAVVDDALLRGEHVLVHCVGGCGRTGMFSACVLVRSGLRAEAAIAHFRRHRRCGPETLEQVAYVVRYEQRRRTNEAQTLGPRVARVTLSERSGAPVLLARGGLSELCIGRAYFDDGTVKRVAVKRFGRPLDHRQAAQLERAIADLSGAGVVLPKMFAWKMNGGEWVQVSQLFGSIARGSKLHQPGDFHARLDAEARRFATDQLTRVVNAGYHPSLDLFLVFRADHQRLLPMDLDLVVPQPNAPQRARELVKRVIVLGGSPKDRDDLRSVLDACAAPEVRVEVARLLDNDASPYRRLWDGLNR